MTTTQLFRTAGAMMPASPSTSEVHRTDLGGNPAMTRWVDGILSHAGIPVGERESVVIYGSALRAVWTREPVGDLNLAAPAGIGGCDVATRSDGGQTVQVSWAPHPLTPESVILGADFTICQAAYRHPWLFHSDRFHRDVQARILCTATLTQDKAEASLLRAVKFAARGYRVTARTLQDLIRSLPTTARALTTPDLQRHSAGLVRAG